MQDQGLDLPEGRAGAARSPPSLGSTLLLHPLPLPLLHLHLYPSEEEGRLHPGRSAQVHPNHLSPLHQRHGRSGMCTAARIVFDVVMEADLAAVGSTG